MGNLEDLYRKQDAEKEENEKIEIENRDRLAVQKYNHEVDLINELTDIIIKKIYNNPPEEHCWIYVQDDYGNDNKYVAWNLCVIGEYYEGNDHYSDTYLSLLSDGRLYGRGGVLNLEHIKYTGPDSIEQSPLSCHEWSYSSKEISEIRKAIVSSGRTNFGAEIDDAYLED